MEELAISEPTTFSETGSIGVEQIDPESTPDQASMNDRDAFSAFPATSGNASVIHHDEEDGPHRGLLNEDVLERVFKHIINRSYSACEQQKRQNKIDILKDVRNIRLVCKTWKNVVTLLYRPIQAPTSFYQVASTWEGLKAFLDVMKNSDLIPVQNYKVASIHIDTDIELFKDFLATCGSDIVSLDLKIALNPMDMFHARGLADLKLEKLKKLELVYQNYHMESWGGDYRMHSFEPFLGIFLNSALEEFKCNSLSSTALIKQFERIICRGLPTTVKVLHMSSILLDEESFATLAANGMKLEEFQLDASCVPGNALAIRKFLESQTNTLKTLLIKGERISESTEFEFPRLNELLCLEMNRSVKPFYITKTFPKLQKLDLERWPKWNGSTLEELLLNESVVLSVEEVIMPVSKECNASLAKTIREHFPNMTKLRIYPATLYSDRTKTLQQVFIHLPNIEQLYIYSDGFHVDSTFSGVSKSRCNRIWREENFAEVSLRNEQSMPTILNLTKLKKLVVIQPSDRDNYSYTRFILTDISAHFVFLQMANLKELSLSGAKFSPTYVELLKNKLDLKIMCSSYACKHYNKSECGGSR